MIKETYYQAEGLKFYYGDCIDYMSQFKNNEFDLGIVDPPYFDGPNKPGYFGARVSTIGVDRPGYNKTKNWNIPKDEYFNELLRVTKHQIIWGINYFSIKNIGPGRIIWDKVNQSSSYSDCEVAYTSLHDSVKLFRYMWNGMNQGKSIDDGHIMQGNKKLNEKRIHPTQKPINLYRWLLKKYAKKGYQILDTYLGSGSIAMACIDFQCYLTAIEIEKSYLRGATERVKDYLKQLRLFN